MDWAVMLDSLCIGATGALFLLMILYARVCARI